MPCYYTGSAAGDAALAAQETRAKLTQMTRAFCEVMSAVDGQIVGLSKETQKLWEEHKKVDSKRKVKKP